MNPKNNSNFNASVPYPFPQYSFNNAIPTPPFCIFSFISKLQDPIILFSEFKIIANK